MDIQEAKILELLSEERTFDRGFEQLVAGYQEKLYWHIRRIVHFHEDADDVIQNTFIKVFRHIKSFKGDSKLYTWLFRIASNEAISFLKNKNKKSFQNLDDHLGGLEQQLRSDPYFDANEAQLMLVKAIEQLPEKQKLVFNMRYYEEMPYDDISEVLGVTVGSLKASFHHAMKKVENYLKQSTDYV